MIAVELLDKPARLDTFRAEWVELARRLTPATPFQTPEWLLTWWKHFGSGEPHLLVFRSDGRAMGVLPGFLHTWNGRRQLTLIGSGISDYLDPLFDPAHTAPILDALREHLTRRPDWDVCDWQDLEAESPLCALGPSRADTPCTRIRLAGSFEEFLCARPKDLRRNLRRYREKAQPLGTFRFSVDTEAKPELLKALIDLHAARWRVSGQPGMIEVNQAAGFLQQVAGELARTDTLRIFSLCMDDRVAAIILALRNPTTIFSYLSAFDPQYEVFGFGRELLAQAIRYAYEQGYRFWDFLRGDEPYKLSWGAETIPKRRLILSRSMTMSSVPEA